MSGEAHSISPDRVGSAITQTNDTRFDVLFDDNHELAGEVKRFLDRFVGVWNRVESPEQASHLVLLPMPDSRFHPCDVDWAEVLFLRKGTEANMYVFDQFEHQLVAIGINSIRARRGIA
jgi:hypothetical protein